jgi:hypothetical protein
MSEPDFQPTLTRPTVIVRPVVADDWQQLFALAPILKSGKCIQSPIATPSPGFGNSSTARSIRKWDSCSSIDRPPPDRLEPVYGYEPELGEIEIGWTFIARSYWGGKANREVKRLMLVMPLASSTPWCSGSATKTGARRAR